ncbi:hypothetical protein H5410_004878 [Solanum commersonii]|uniref:Phospholipase A1 n=1 Tax=Solanum commersonii TaxID=4109 RepID=A0A9J6A626_SOLCO|nr:hypothetical protein H5410_004878 [Solanum commersonii]
MEGTMFEVKVKKRVVFVNKTSSSLKNEFLIPWLWWVEKNKGMVFDENEEWILAPPILVVAGRKKAIPYGGDMAVSNIINFLAHHGSHFYDLPQEKGEFPDLKIFVVAHHPSE